MLASHWLDRISAANVGARMDDARDALAATLDHGNRALVDGLDASRALGENVFGSARRVAHSTREQIGGHPLETALIVGLASFAIGWVAARRMRRAQTLRSNGAARKTTAASTKARAATRRRTRAAT